METKKMSGGRRMREARRLAAEKGDCSLCCGPKGEDGTAKRCARCAEQQRASSMRFAARYPARHGEQNRIASKRYRARKSAAGGAHAC